jgi:hypothetical protein
MLHNFVDGASFLCLEATTHNKAPDLWTTGTACAETANFEAKTKSELPVLMQISICTSSNQRKLQNTNAAPSINAL